MYIVHLWANQCHCGFCCPEEWQMSQRAGGLWQGKTGSILRLAPNAFCKPDAESALQFQAVQFPSQPRDRQSGQLLLQLHCRNCTAAISFSAKNSFSPSLFSNLFYYFQSLFNPSQIFPAPFRTTILFLHDSSLSPDPTIQYTITSNDLLRGSPINLPLANWNIISLASQFHVRSRAIASRPLHSEASAFGKNSISALINFHNLILVAVISVWFEFQLFQMRTHWNRSYSDPIRLFDSVKIATEDPLAEMHFLFRGMSVHAAAWFSQESQIIFVGHFLLVEPTMKQIMSWNQGSLHHQLSQNRLLSLFSSTSYILALASTSTYVPASKCGAWCPLPASETCVQLPVR